MFGFLKNKLKSIFGKAKDSEKPKKEKKPKEKKQEKLQQIKEKPKKQEKKKRTKEEIQEERHTTEEIIKDIAHEHHEIKTPEEQFEQETKEQEEIKEEPKKFSFFQRLKKVFSYNITESDFEEIFSELEFSLLESNVSLEVVDKIRENLKKELIGKEIKKSNLAEEIQNSLKNAIKEILIDPEDLITKIKNHKKSSSEPFVILFFGINGTGKTTSIAKLAHYLKKNKFSVVLAAADTFRAASIEQIQLHADKLQVKLIKGEYGNDPSSIGFEAIKYAKTNKIEVVLIDTAGRMHTKENLLNEMNKICRVTKPNLKVFVAEAVSGNDATEQAKAFNDLIGIDGSILSKVDVDEKGGAILSIGYTTKKPILFLGLGQNYEDLEVFSKDKFLERLGL